MNPTTTNKIHAALAIDQFWAIEPKFANSMLDSLASTPADAMLGKKSPPTELLEVVGSDAVILMSGPMMKGFSSFGDNCSTVYTRRAIRSAANNPLVERIILVMDSPGGSVFGTADLADDVLEAAKIKPVIAYIEDLCASACYWVASACTEIVASPNALAIGSIGVYTVFWDESELYEKFGVKPILISSGGEKGKPVPGLPVEDETIEVTQSAIDMIYEQFVGAVASGRGLESTRVLSIADGRIFPAQEALGLGLVDRLASWDELFETSASDGNLAASEANETMGILDKFIKKQPEVPAAETDKVETPQAEATEVHDMAAIEAAMQGAVAGIVKTKVDSYIDAGHLTAASRESGEELLLSAIEADGLGFEANGSLKEGRMFAAAKKLIEGLPKASLANKVLETTPGSDANGARSVVEADQFKSEADAYRAKAEKSTPGMKKVKK